jgi:hypothetical protein
MDERDEKQNNKIFLWAFCLCILVGGFGAYNVALSTSGYGASMTFWLLVLFCGLPIILILFVLAIIAAVKDQAKYTIALSLSCIMLPVCFIGSLKLMEATKIAKYKQVSDEIRPIGSELNERIVIAFKETASQEETHKFDETILRKTIPQPNGVLLEFADGVCGIAYPDTEFKYEIVDVGFCNDAIDEQKKIIKEKVNSSTIVYKVFENLPMEDIKNLSLDKRKVDTSPKVDNKKVKTVQ